MAEKKLTIEEAINAYSREADTEFVASAGEERKEIIQRFPLDLWKDMSLEKYAVGQENSDDTFCRWIEFKARHLGSMRGGSSRKLIIYKHKGKPGWFYDPDYRSKQDAWQAVRGAFVKAFELANAGDFNSIDDLEPLRSGSALRLKVLHLYFPDEILCPLPPKLTGKRQDFIAKDGGYASY